MVAISPPTAGTPAAAAALGVDVVEPRSYLGEVRARFMRKRAGQWILSAIQQTT